MDNMLMMFKSTSSVLISVFFYFFLLTTTTTNGFDVFDPFGNITIQWDIKQWSPDGYVAKVEIRNNQQYRHVQQPGWELGWTWADNEIIWGMSGAEAIDQGDCSKFKGRNIPHSCMRTPAIVDLLPGAQYSQQVANCCRGGVLSSTLQDPLHSASTFEMRVGQAGTSLETVRVPENFTITTPSLGYTCGNATIVQPTKFLSPDGRRVTRSLVSWIVTCTYSQFRARKTPTCCVSLSAFYSETLVSCPTCACGCPNSTVGTCTASPHSTPDLSLDSSSPHVECTTHMCPIRVHWHIKLNYRGYWRVKVTVTNFNQGRNISDWNLVMQHPAMGNLVDSVNFESRPLITYGSINDTAMFWGIRHINDLLLEAGPMGFVQSELLFEKDKESFTLDNGWAFPRKIYFDGDFCTMPPPESYPFLPSRRSSGVAVFIFCVFSLICLVFLFFVYLLLRKYKRN